MTDNFHTLYNKVGYPIDYPIRVPQWGILHFHFTSLTFKPFLRATQSWTDIVTQGVAKFQTQNSLTFPWIFQDFFYFTQTLSQHFFSFSVASNLLKSEIFEMYRNFDTFSALCWSQKKFALLSDLLSKVP